MSAYKIFMYNGPSSIILQNRLRSIQYINTTARLLSTIDEREMEIFNNFKDTWWDKNGCLYVLHRLNPLRIQFMKDSLANVGFKVQNSSLPLQTLKIADVGCGGGILTEDLAKIGAHVTGIDAAKMLIKVAKNHIESQPDIAKRVNYIHTTIEEFSQNNKEAYDVVIASEVVEHVDNPEMFLKECTKILKPGGSIFITTPGKTLMSWFYNIIIGEYILNFIPRRTHQLKKFVSPLTVQHIFNDCNCLTLSIRGFIYNPISGQWVWTNSRAIQYALHAIKLNRTAAK